jgi:hypothetical protein
MAKRNTVLSEADLLGACACVACRALLDECGVSNFVFLRSRLLVKGWAGQRTPVERAYQKAPAKDWARGVAPQGSRFAKGSARPQTIDMERSKVS